MSVYKTSIEVEAEQWYPPIPIPGVELVRPYVIYSKDKSLYHITGPAGTSSAWLTVKKFSQKPEVSGLAGVADFTKQFVETYYRKTYAFATYDIKSDNEAQPADENGELYQDYAAVMDWPAAYIQYAFVTDSKGNHTRVNMGDYVVIMPDGQRVVLPQSEFANTYCLADKLPGSTDPVVREPDDFGLDAWWFWDESWSERHGPFATEEEARDELDAYCGQLHGIGAVDQQPTPRALQLLQLMRATCDAEVKDQDARDELVKSGYAVRTDGWNIATAKGVRLLLILGGLP